MIIKFCYSQCQQDKVGGGNGNGTVQGTCTDMTKLCLQDGSCKVGVQLLNLIVKYTLHENNS